jgi:hypothetical protein
LVLQQGARLRLPVLVIYDGSKAARRALEASAHLVQGKNEYLTVLILADEESAVREMQTDVAGWLREMGLEAHYRWLVGVDVQQIDRLVQEEGCGVLILPSQSSRLRNEMFLTMLDEVECPVLLVR